MSFKSLYEYFTTNNNRQSSLQQNQYRPTSTRCVPTSRETMIRNPHTKKNKQTNKSSIITDEIKEVTIYKIFSLKKVILEKQKHKNVYKRTLLTPFSVRRINQDLKSENELKITKIFINT